MNHHVLAYYLFRDIFEPRGMRWFKKWLKEVMDGCP